MHMAQFFFILFLILTILTGLGGQVWNGRYHGNSDMIRCSSQFWFLPFLAGTILCYFWR